MARVPTGSDRPAVVDEGRATPEAEHVGDHPLGGRWIAVEQRTGQRRALDHDVDIGQPLTAPQHVPIADAARSTGAFASSASRRRNAGQMNMQCRSVGARQIARATDDSASASNATPSGSATSTASTWPTLPVTGVSWPSTTRAMAPRTRIRGDVAPHLQIRASGREHLNGQYPRVRRLSAMRGEAREPSARPSCFRNSACMESTSPTVDRRARRRKVPNSRKGGAKLTALPAA